MKTHRKYKITVYSTSGRITILTQTVKLPHERMLPTAIAALQLLAQAYKGLDLATFVNVQEIIELAPCEYEDTKI